MKVCQVKSPPYSPGFSKQQEKKLRSRKRRSRCMSEEDKWIEVYRILFPNDIAVPPAFVDGPSAIGEYAQYQAFSRQELKQILGGQLRRIRTSPSMKLNDKMKDELLDIVMDCQEQVFHRFGQSKVPISENRDNYSAIPSQINDDGELMSPVDLEYGPTASSDDSPSLDLESKSPLGCLPGAQDIAIPADVGQAADSTNHHVFQSFSDNYTIHDASNPTSLAQKVIDVKSEMEIDPGTGAFTTLNSLDPQLESLGPDPHLVLISDQSMMARTLPVCNRITESAQHSCMVCSLGCMLLNSQVNVPMALPLTPCPFYELSAGNMVQFNLHNEACGNGIPWYVYGQN